MSVLVRHHRRLSFRWPSLFHKIPSCPLSALPSNSPQIPDPRSNLSARLAFIFDQIDAVDNRTSEKFDALHRIREWRESRNQQENVGNSDENEEKSRGQDANLLTRKKEVEVAHPWAEWIEFVVRLAQQNYFDPRRLSEEKVAKSVGIDLSGVKEEIGFDFSMDWTAVRNACTYFCKDRYDILRSLSKKDIQILVGHGCPSMDPKVVFSAKLLRKYTHLDEGDVCSSCSLRSSCSSGYILTYKEDEARTLDVIRVLLTYGFDHVNGAVENKPLMQMKSVKTVVRKLLHEVVKLSAVPIDPNLPPPIIKKPSKVKQPPPPSKRRIGRDDVEMKKGDWFCHKCDFMNFAKNSICLQCDAKRQKRQLLPGEWECPQCNFLNYRRNMACFHCDAKRPPDEFTENQLQPRQSSSQTMLDRAARVQDVSKAWNFDFDDNESDGADVAAFEFANSNKIDGGSDIDDLPHGRTFKSFDHSIINTSNISRTHERGRNFSDDSERKSASHGGRTGFDDFDDEEEDAESYVLDTSNNNQVQNVLVRSLSEVEDASGSEDFDDFDRHTNFKQGANDNLAGSEDDDDLADLPQLKSSHITESWKSGRRGRRSISDDDEDDDFDLGSDHDDDMDEGLGSKQRNNRQQSSGRKGISRRGIDSDSDARLLLDSDLDADDSDLYSGRDRTRGDRGRSVRGANNFRKSNDFGNRTTKDFRSGDRRSNRRTDDFCARGSPRDTYGVREGNDRFQRSDRQDNGHRGSGNGSKGENDRFERFDRYDARNTRHETSNQSSDRSSLQDERGSRGNGHSGWRDDDGFQQGRNNNFRDRSRSFGNDENNDRPRRVIER